jgi:hypothetical protein
MAGLRNLFDDSLVRARSFGGVIISGVDGEIQCGTMNTYHTLFYLETIFLRLLFMHLSYLSL